MQRSDIQCPTRRPNRPPRLKRLRKINTNAGDSAKSCETASGLVISYVPQDTSFLSGSIPEFCEEQGLDRSLFCTVLRQLDLSRSQLGKDISEYSAGQKKKVILAASIMTPAHLYIWDEPLNFIDIFSRIQLETLLNSYEPTILFAEHDIRFRENIGADTICISNRNK